MEYGALMSKKILLVDDDVREREIVSELLTRRGARFIAIGTGEEALGLLMDQHNPVSSEISVVFLDLVMPGVDGIEVLKAVREAAVRRKVPVVVLTSSKNDADVALSYALGANAYLAKPDSDAALAALIEAATRFWTEINVFPPSHPG
jgi:CheY-like chemotaxis protein